MRVQLCHALSAPQLLRTQASQMMLVRGPSGSTIQRVGSQGQAPRTLMLSLRCSKDLFAIFIVISGFRTPKS